MAVPDFQTLMLPVLKLAAQGETRVVEHISKVIGSRANERD